MKNFYLPASLALIISFSITACSGPDKPAEVKNIDSFETITEQPDTVLFWTVNVENRIKQRVYQDTITITQPESVVNGIRSIYPDIPLQFNKISGDTVYVSVDSASARIDDMGSFGAGEYIATVVLNLTSLPNINFVNLDIKEGSHAAPGVFAKERFSRYKVQE
ncbi:MAG: hypothetical protein KIT80_02070 [Chitinophagaceae bacterium]|nr:hypothetical protein [Chitinophagaceae bacterium]MCW5925671.1 hypothetical protein [Chitinophagaceae bacterium]